jgi:hypothetical protein
MTSSHSTGSFRHIDQRSPFVGLFFQRGRTPLKCDRAVGSAESTILFNVRSIGAAQQDMVSRARPFRADLQPVVGHVSEQLALGLRKIDPINGGEKMILTKLRLAIVAVLIGATSAFGDFDLQITEMWPGNEPGENLTQDWFELTNVGDMAWTETTDGSLWFDDDSADPTTADLLMNVGSIAPGESVVFVDGFVDGNPANVDEFLEIWNPVKPQGQLGTYQGSGLGQGGDAVSIWISAAPPKGAPDLFEAYPDSGLNGGQSFDSILSAFSTDGNLSGAVTTIAVNTEGQPAIGSPGMIVPEPSGLMLSAFALMQVGRLRRIRSSDHRNSAVRCR